MSSTGDGSGTIDETSAAKALQKRFDGLVTVKNKAVKGKGAWYWAHLEPLLLHNSDNALPKAVKLKCCLCNTIFSASNPSRTASEHLKRGTCANFFSVAGTTPPPLPSHGVVGGGVVEVGSQTGEEKSLVTPPPPKQNPRKRRASSSGGCVSGVVANNNTAGVSGVVVVEPSRLKNQTGSSTEMGVSEGALVVQPQNTNLNFQQLTPPVLVSCSTDGGVNKLKSPKELGGDVTLNKSQIECAIDYLSDWVYESCGSVSFSSLEHPKFKAFLHQVGLNEVSKREFFGSRLDSRFEVIKNECDGRIRDAMFFQVASHGWKSKSDAFDDNLASLIVNLPNGSSVYRRSVFTTGQVSGKFAEEIICETIADICGNSVQHCVGIVSDKFKSAVLKNLESRYHWMINLSCQCRAFDSLLKDLYNELPLFKNVAESCLRLANFVRNKTIMNCFHKYQSKDYGLIGFLRLPGKDQEISSFESVCVMIEDIMSSARVLQLVLSDESYKIACMEDPVAREFGEIIRDVGFWSELEAVRSLVKLVKELANEFETDRPLVGQCLPLWEDLRNKVKEWCAKFHIADVIVDNVIEIRFRKNYHPAWAAAYVLDPFYMIRDTTGNYLPPFKYLSPEQQKDVHDLVTRLVSREEIPIAMSELMRWRSNGLDPVYAQAVQLKQRDPNTGKMRIANPQGSRLVWETYLPDFKSLGRVALRLIFLHATSRGFKCNTSILNWVKNHGRSRVALEKAQKIIYIAGNSKLERRDFTSEEDKDAELFASAYGENNVLNETFADP